jgi:hypothetical protein
MEMEIEAAVSHGINLFVYDWYWYDHRPFLENCLNDGFLKARNCQKMQFYLMWANHCARYNWDKRNCNLPLDNPIWSGLVDEKEFVRMTDRIIDNYFSQPNYYKIKGCPVFSVYTLYELLQSFGSLGAIRQAFDGFRNRTVRAGFPGLHLQFIARAHGIISYPQYHIHMTQKELMDALGVDSITNYGNGCYTGTDISYEKSFPKITEYHAIADTYAIPYFPSISLGWDNNPRYDIHTLKPKVITNNTPENFEIALRMMKEYADRHPENPPLIIINAWNEWTEANYLQPDDINGYAMLETVKKVFV